MNFVFKNLVISMLFFTCCEATAPSKLSQILPTRSMSVQGPTGPTGPTGATGHFSTAFGSYYTENSSSPDLVTSSNFSIPFSTVITETPPIITQTTPTQFTIGEDGLYLVWWTLALQSQNLTQELIADIDLSLSLHTTGVLVPDPFESIMFKPNDANTVYIEPVSGSAVLPLLAGEVIELKIVTDTTPDTLLYINPSISVIKITPSTS